MPKYPGDDAAFLDIFEKSSKYVEFDRDISLSPSTEDEIKLLEWAVDSKLRAYERGVRFRNLDELIQSGGGSTLRGRHRIAEKHFALAVKDKRFAPDKAYYALAGIQISLGKFKKAAETLRIAAQTMPDRYGCREKIGIHIPRFKPEGGAYNEEQNTANCELANLTHVLFFRRDDILDLPNSNEKNTDFDALQIVSDELNKLNFMRSTMITWGLNVKLLEFRPDVDGQSL